MNSRSIAARAARLTTLAIFVSASAWPADAPTAADLARCAAMTAPDARLACYDSLTAPAAPAAPASPVTPSASAPSLPAAAPKVPVTNAVAAPPPITTPVPVPAPAPANSVPAPAAGNVASSPTNDPRNFGLSAAQVQAQTQAPPPGLQSIQAHITNVLTDRQGNGYVLLDNGQMWTYQGDDGRMRPGEPVTIKRASLGSFIMVTQSKRSYHVIRQR